MDNNDSIYICVKCGKENRINFKDNIRCKECGYKILKQKRREEKVSYLSK